MSGNSTLAVLCGKQRHAYTLLNSLTENKQISLIKLEKIFILPACLLIMKISIDINSD